MDVLEAINKKHEEIMSSDEFSPEHFECLCKNIYLNDDSYENSKMYLCDCCLVSMGYPVNNTKNIRSTVRVGIFDGPFLTTNMRRELEGILFFNFNTADFETWDIKQVLPQKTSLGYIMAVERVTEEAVEKYREIYGRKEMPTPTEAEWMKQGIDIDKDKCPYGDNPFGRSAQVIESSAQGTGDSAQ